MMVEATQFKSSYFLRALRGDFNPFTPNILTIDDNHVEYRRRNWFLISVDTENLHFQNITGITVDKHLFGSSILIKSTGNDPIIVHGYWKKKTNLIKEMCSIQISSNTQKGTTEALAEAISMAVGNTRQGQTSVADELKKMKELFDVGVLTQQEFEEQKRKLINN